MAGIPVLETQWEMLRGLTRTPSHGVTVPILCQAQSHYFPGKRARSKGLYFYKF